MKSKMKTIILVIMFACWVFAGGWTPLHQAAKEGQEDKVKSLIEGGADVNAINNGGWTPLHHAVEGGHENAIKALIEGRANVNIKQNGGWSPLHQAVASGHANIVKLLIEKGADINIKKDDGWTPLHHAVTNDLENIVKILIEKGADVNVEKEKWTPLHFAAQKGSNQIVELLLKAGADANAKTAEGDTPKDIAAGRNQHTTVNILAAATKDTSQTEANVTPNTEAPMRKQEPTNRPAIEACETYSKLPRNRIINGNTVDSGDFPWMAALGYLSESYQISFDCGGTVISDQFILTAAHCVRSSRSPVVVRLGKITLSDMITDGIKPANYQIREIIRHKENSIVTKKNDIALIRLLNPIIFNVDIVPACLQTDIRDEGIDVRMIVTGWGSISPEKTQKSNELLKAQLQTMSLDECNRTMINYNVLVDLPAFRGGISESQYCAYDPQGRNDSCQGDSGGPLQIFSEGKADLATVVGVVSFGISCGSTLPGIYTRVAYYLDWIESIVWPSS